MSSSRATEDDGDVIVEEEVTYEEVTQPHVIETGDSVKVKQVLDDSAMAAITDAGYEANYRWDNMKMLLMLLACAFAMIAQFFPIPFPSSRPLLAVCCAGYFIISSILQFIMTFIDKDTIMFTKANKKFEHDLKIRSSFPRFQEYFNLIVQFKDQIDSPSATAKMYVGKYFTIKGEFDEESFQRDVKNLLERFANQKYTEIEYNHKLD
eukprot:gene15468-20870_t